jgi:spatacsin
MASQVLFGLETLQRFLEGAIDRAIDVCLDHRRVGDARAICEWRNRDPHNIQLLETVQMVIAGDALPPENEALIATLGDRSNLQALLDGVAAANGWRFVLISLHYKAAIILGLPTENLLHRKTADFVASPLSLTIEHWPLVRNLIRVAKMAPGDVARCLTDAYLAHVLAPREGLLSPDEYGEQFGEFTRLCENPNLVGDRLFEVARAKLADLPLSVAVNILLHSALASSDIDDCAELLDSMLDVLTPELIVAIVSVFPDPALLPRFFQYLIAQQKLDSLPQAPLNEKLGRVIMNCARQVMPFEPQRYYELALRYKLFREYAELQMESGARILENAPDTDRLQEASRCFLLALAYFLHEKCYSLSMECLKKLSLISLQLEIGNPSILKLEHQQVLQLMRERDFPFVLTLAVSYDLDTEAHWADAIYAQSIAKKGEDFLAAYQYFRPITAELCKAVVNRFKSGSQDPDQRDRMKQFLSSIPNLVERYRIAKSLSFDDQIESMKETYPVVCEWCERVLMSKP